MRLVVGQITRPHGIRGEVVVHVTTDRPEAWFVVGSVLATDPATGAPIPGLDRAKGLLIEAVRPHQDRLIVAFADVLDRNGAEALRGAQLWVDSADVADPEDPDEFNDFQLIGLAAVDTAGERLGEVIRIQHGPAADLLVVRLVEGRDVLVPFVRAIVPSVDVTGGRVVLTPPEGLFEL
jgi:16S rRNA processing protein RimM